MIYEFQCRAGHVTEAMVPMGTSTWVCEACVAEMRALSRAHPDHFVGRNPLAFRILSPTRTTFKFADRSARKS